ncbi:S9 family peptidase [Halomonas sp. V046]|uniref:S9 family peptidase n=1 Tax=Halomonas sp. V046 TaxID=3459611 RepID=UPI004043D0EF
MKAQPPNHAQSTQRHQPGLSTPSDFRRPEDPEWHWLEDRDDGRVQEFLHAANASSDAWFSPLEPLAEALYQGHLARRELAVKGLATRLDHFTVWSETAADADYPQWWRHPNDAAEASECFLDLEARARAQAFLELGDMALSPDEQWLAWTEDTQGDETYTLHLKRLPDGEPLALLDQLGAELCWAEDGTTLLFTRYDATQRPDSAWRLPLSLAPDGGCRAGDPVLVWREADPEFWIGLGKTRSRQWLLIESASKDTSESHLVPADRPATPPRCFQPRSAGVEYALDHRPGHFYILHNQDAVHFQLDVVAEGGLGGEGQRKTLVPHREEVTLEGVDAYAWGLVVGERDHGEAQVSLRRVEFDAAGDIITDDTLPTSAGPLSVGLGDTPHFDARVLRLREESFTTPASWWSLDLDSGDRKLLKQAPLHGDLGPADLACDRLWAIAHDGERVPVSVVRRADLVGQALPTLLYGYGAYGEALDPWFSAARLELLARGVAFAVAHVRGGGERGEPWYLAGKLEHKPNSFHDFLAARDTLVDQGLADAERIVAYGASAGGLLVGASLNLAPTAFCAAVLDVPFVDVLRTMENPDLPLTTAEYTEWGNPEDPRDARRIRDYSPLDNLAARDWPTVFLQGSWHDTRVPYWEPAKLYARLAQANAETPSLSNRPVLLRTDMESGHGGASGRFKAWRDGARQDAFILWALGLSDGAGPPRT